MRGEAAGQIALWPFALELYGRPGVEALLLELQDKHGQSVPYLIWALWLADNGRPADRAALAAGAALARAWEAVAVTPLRQIRRDLKTGGPATQRRQRAQLREKVKGLELEAERMLLSMLEHASPAAAGEVEPAELLRRAVAAWSGRKAPAALLESLTSQLG